MSTLAQKATAKRIHKVTIKRMVDESPDTSWGEYASQPTSEYSIDRAHDLDCASQEYNQPSDEGRTHLASAIHYLNTSYNESSDSWDICAAMELLDNVNACNCSEHGDMQRNEYQYFNPSFNYVNKQGRALPENTPEDIRKYVRQDYERMESLNRGDWCFLGIRADAEYSVDSVGSYAPVQKITSGGLWGIESDSDREYLESVEREELSELRTQLHAIGFSQRAISAAFRDVERVDG